MQIVQLNVQTRPMNCTIRMLDWSLQMIIIEHSWNGHRFPCWFIPGGRLPFITMSQGWGTLGLPPDDSHEHCIAVPSIHRRQNGTCPVCARTRNYLCLGLETGTWLDYANSCNYMSRFVWFELIYLSIFVHFPRHFKLFPVIIQYAKSN